MLRLALPGPHNIETKRVRLYDGSVVTRSYTYECNDLGYPVSYDDDKWVWNPVQRITIFVTPFANFDCV
jgi:hypothetical protein